MSIPSFEDIITPNDQTEARKASLEAIAALVGNVYPNKFVRSSVSGGEDTITALKQFDKVADIEARMAEIKASLGEGERPPAEKKDALNEELKALGTVRIAGRLTTPTRGNFVHLTDGMSKLQVYCNKKGPLALIKNDGDDTLDAENGWALWQLLDHGDLIGVEGYLFVTNTGEVSVHVEKLQFLTKAMLPMPDKMHGIADPELQRRFRYADLIASTLQVEHDGLTTREVFERRAKLVSGLRRFLDDAGFIEVETPMLTPKATGAAAKPFETHHNALDIPLYARVAPELYLKRLVVGGFEKVYELNRNFRNEGLSQRHNPEFTMLEFYVAYMDVNGMMDLAETMIKDAVAKANGGQRIIYDGTEIDFSVFQRISMKEAVRGASGKIRDLVPEELQRIMDGDWLANTKFVYSLSKSLLNRQKRKVFNQSVTLNKFVDGELKFVDGELGSMVLDPKTQQDQIDSLLREGWEKGITSQHREDGSTKAENLNRNWRLWEKEFDGDEFREARNDPALVSLFDEYVEPNLIQPTFVVDYPKSISPLSKASPDNPQVAERFELFINGMEVANGFSELNDPKEQYERFVDQMSERERGDEEAMIMDEDYIRALSYGMPPAAGIGIGIDRLVMLLTNKHSIRDVILFPHMRPEKRSEPDEATGKEEDGQ